MIAALLLIAFIDLLPSFVTALPYVAPNQNGGATPSASGSVASSIRNTWHSPGDVLTILLIIGGDIISKALAQLSGPPIAPVAFSFGWVSYSLTTLMQVFGDGRLMPAPDYPAKLFNVESGISRDNRSWVLGRLLRDMGRPMKDGVGMRINIFRVTKGGPAVLDWTYYSGIAVIIIQLIVAAIPCGLYGDWSTILVTGAGTVLALITGALPQWRKEKFVGRRRNNKSQKKTVALTEGNGSRNVIVIIDETKEVNGPIDLEDLAAAQSPLRRHGQPGRGHPFFGQPLSLRFTQLACIVLAMLWIIFLLITTGLKSHPWYLLFVGGLGMLQNVIVAGAPRQSSASMIHLEKINRIEKAKVMFALMDAEKQYPNLGRVLLAEFFSIDSLRSDEKKWWDGDEEEYETWRRKKTKAMSGSEAEKTSKVGKEN